MRHALALLLSTFLVSAAYAAEDHGHDEHAQEHHDDHEDDSHVSEAHGLRALHPWTNASDEATALIFVELENTGDKDITITGAESHDAQSAELVGFVLENGEGTYKPVPKLVLKPGREITLEPRSLAIRLTGVSAHRHEGDEMELHLVTDHGEIDLHVAVEAADATQHSHAGHAH